MTSTHHCANCGRRLGTVETREAVGRGGSYTWRRRRCGHCGLTIETLEIERPEGMRLDVVKPKTSGRN
jgi:ribosomal protein L34E